METLPLPASLAPWRVAEVTRLRAAIAECVPDASGVRRWQTNGKCVPAHVFRDAFLTCSPAQEAAEQAEVSLFLAEYRRSARAPSAEERCEARAAFGRGVRVVDVLSGRRYTT